MVLYTIKLTKLEADSLGFYDGQIIYVPQFDLTEVRFLAHKVVVL